MYSTAGRVEVGFGEDGSGGRVEAGAGIGGEHGAAGGDYGGEGGEADGDAHVIIDGLDATLAEIGFVPEAGAAGIAQEVFPPLAVGVGAGPGHQGIEIAPVLADADVGRE